MPSSCMRQRARVGRKARREPDRLAGLLLGEVHLSQVEAHHGELLAEACLAEVVPDGHEAPRGGSCRGRAFAALRWSLRKDQLAWRAQGSRPDQASGLPPTLAARPFWSACPPHRSRSEQTAFSPAAAGDDLSKESVFALLRLSAKPAGTGASGGIFCAVSRASSSAPVGRP
jgi:hypothetical protein